MNSNQSHTTPLTAPIAAPHAQPALTHTPPMAVPASPAAHYALPFDNQPYENVQYLSRQHFYHPPAVALGQLPPPEEALAAIEGMLREQWEKYRGHQPIDVHPTFSAAPQSRYIGSYTSPGGQLVHRSVAMNNLEVLTDERTGLPYTLAGHTVRDTYSVPAASDAVWPLELFYPSNERLHDEMTRFMKEPPPEGDPGFPVHATPESPPMQAGMPGGRAVSHNSGLEMRGTHAGWKQTHVNETYQASIFSAAEPLTPMARRFRQENLTTVSPSDTTRATAEHTGDPSLFTRHSPESDSTASSMPSLEPIPEQPMTSRLEQLNRDIRARASRDLAFENEPWTPGSEGNASSEGLGICAVCFEPAHDPWTPCPPNAGWRAPTPPFMIPGHPPTPPLFIAHQPEGRVQDEQYNEQRVHDMVQGTLGPILEEFVNLPSDEEGAWGEIANKAQEARAVFEQLNAILEDRRIKAEKLRDEAKNLENERSGGKLTGCRIHNRLAGPEASDAETRGTDLSEVEYSAARALASFAHRPASAPVEIHESHAGAVPIPNFNRSSGEPVTRETWSSSFGTDSSHESFLEINPYTSHPGQPAVNARGIISPTVSEWIQAQRGDFSDIAGHNSKLLLARWNKSMLPASWEQPSPTQRRVSSKATFRLTVFTSFVDGLRKGRNATKKAFNGRMGFTATLFATVWRCSMDLWLAFWIIQQWPLSRTPNSPPDPTQSPTSLDFSLPSPPVASTRGDVTDSDFRMEPMHLGAKRPPPTSDEAFLEARKRRKCPTGLADAEVVKKFAGVRQGCLEGARRIEGAVWARYPVTQWVSETEMGLAALQAHFPEHVAAHPFFREDEVLKMFVLHNVLQAQGRHVLASLLADVLAVRVRDEYTVSALLDAGYLDATYPPDDNEPWWKLLEATDTESNHSDDSSLSSLGYPLSREDEALDNAMEGVSGRGAATEGSNRPVNYDRDRRMDCDGDGPGGRVATCSAPIASSGLGARH
ncbi:hypothetical protein C8R47DRAFT_1084471 [Mycena vitilis]|nr:hypothetical protein C8R47DRAFT_1084471 [Mycena vitilis]